ncbi:hypothetical protein ASE75_01905 [Sphingomonas sp. Leaf17]|uniref:hypothetical protein n=1 Tax=Sphingomonas sp. Leaf17 TaxID=1735683 RepID=UPI0006FCD703|nr:hypothetical protein [Sphingomonas sp. Leaf17]KQM67699.1 hypothetical protein ASE75_01905 [Sphingomonas sp. Leaf17]
MAKSFVAQAARASILSIGAAVAVFAATGASAETVVKPEVATASIAAKPVRYCFQTTATGTYITGKSCKTGAEWRRLGVEPNDYASKFRRAVTGSRLAIVDDAR